MTRSCFVQIIIHTLHNEKSTNKGDRSDVFIILFPPTFAKNNSKTRCMCLKCAAIYSLQNPNVSHRCHKLVRNEQRCVPKRPSLYEPWCFLFAQCTVLSFYHRRIDTGAVIFLISLFHLNEMLIRHCWNGWNWCCANAIYCTRMYALDCTGVLLNICQIADVFIQNDQSKSTAKQLRARALV